MKKDFLIIVVFLFVLISCTQNTNKVSAVSLPLADTNKVVVVTDTVRLPGGFWIGMTEAEIRSYVKMSPKRFFLNNNQLLAMLHTRINSVDYSMHIDLYRGKLHSIMYFSNANWSEIDDPGLRKHYDKMYTLIKGLNKYPVVKNVYEKKYQASWPYSAGYDKSILMAEFNLSPGFSGGNNNFSIYLVSDDNGKLSIDFSYFGVDKTDNESTLSKSLYFD